ncbi:MAG TPA: hypothetical protein VFQ40_01180 [Actinomycetota bacterium]|nr:hypothetical protein [Actinomycetota bacterium]
MTVTVLGPAPSGLAALLGDLLEQNLSRDPRRRALLRPCVAVLEATDAGVTVFLRIGPGEVRVGDGDVPDAHLRVRARGERLLTLTIAPLRGGLPDVARPGGRAIVRDLLAGRLVVRGLLRHPVRLTRLTALLSVAEDR